MINRQTTYFLSELKHIGLISIDCILLAHICNKDCLILRSYRSDGIIFILLQLLGAIMRHCLTNKMSIVYRHRLPSVPARDNFLNLITPS